MSRWVRCSYGKRAGFVVAKIVHFLESTNNSEDFFVEIRVKSESFPYSKKFYSIAVTHPVSYNSGGVCGVFLPGDVCDANVIYTIF